MLIFYSLFTHKIWTAKINFYILFHFCVRTSYVAISSTGFAVHLQHARYTVGAHKCRCAYRHCQRCTVLVFREIRHKLNFAQVGIEYTRGSTYTHTHTHTCMYVSVCLCVCMYVCMCVCVCVCVYIYIYIYIYIYARQSS